MSPRKSLACALAAALLASTAAVPPALAAPPPTATLAGDWSGVLPYIPAKRVILHIRRAGDEVRVTLDVPDLGAQGIPIQDLRLDGAKVAFAIPAAQVRFEGELQPGAREVRGTFTDHEFAQPLVLAFSASDAPPPPFKVPAPAAAWKTPSEDRIREVLKTEIAARQAVGLVVGVVGPGGRTVVSEGVSDPADPRPIAADTPLFVESVAKAFTGLLLADMATRGEVKLDDPLDSYLPPGVKAPERNGRRITLADLGTHTSGLPRGLPDVAPDQFAYPAERMYARLAEIRLTRDPGERWEYSDLGGALLGHALERRAGMDFESLMRARITGPLGMTMTTTRLTPEMRRRLPVEHDPALRRVDNTVQLAGAFAPSYGLYSTVDDLMKLLELQLGYVQGPLSASAELARTARRPISPGAEHSIAWEVRSFGQPPIRVFAASGKSPTMNAYMAFRPDTRVGVVVYANAATSMPPEDIGLFVLTGRPVPAPPPSAPGPAPTAAVVVPAETLARYAGRYRLTPETAITISAEGTRLFGRLNDNPLTELFASSPSHFFARTANVQVDFVPGPDGRTASLRLLWNGADLTAERIGD